MKKPELEDILGDCLHETLNIMVCSDSIVFRRTVDALLRKYRPFSFFTADSPETMDNLFRQVTAWHGVIVERHGKPAGKFLSRVRQHSSWLPVIVLDGADGDQGSAGAIDKEENSARAGVGECEAGWESAAVRADIVMIPCSIRDEEALCTALQTWSVKRKLFGVMPHGNVVAGIEALFQKNPASLSAWAIMLNTTQRKFQRQFKSFTNLSPKKMLAVYQAYKIVFAEIDAKKRCHQGAGPAYLSDHHRKERIIEYVLTRRSSLLLS
jgi:hypothetical protein